VAGIEDLGPYWQAAGRGRRFRLQAVAREPRVAAISRMEDAVQVTFPEGTGAQAHPQPAVPG